MNGDERRGGQHYNKALVEEYLQHRHRPVSSPNLVMEDPAFAMAAGDLGGLRILDLGCGDGTFARRCHAEGSAHYLGIDGSQAMIERAEESAGGLPGIHFKLLDLEDFAAGITTTNAELEPPRLAPTEAGGFDLVTARMVLHYVEDLGPVLTRVRQLLTPGGRLIFTVIHPVVTAAETVPGGPRTSQPVDGYFKTGPRQRTWFDTSVIWHHRTIEHHLRLLAETGFTVDAFSECRPVESEFNGNTEEYLRRLQVPLFLLIGATA